MKIRNLFFLGCMVIGALLISGCNTDDCDNSFSCDTVLPTYGILTVRISPDAENPLVPIAVYVGNIEDSSLYFVDTISQTTDYYVDLDTRYSGSAKYRIGSQSLIAIDGDRVELKSENNCEYTCYTVKDGELKLDIKK